MSNPLVRTRKESRAQDAPRDVGFVPPPSSFGVFGAGNFGGGVEVDTEPEIELIVAELDAELTELMEYQGEAEPFGDEWAEAHEGYVLEFADGDPMDELAESEGVYGWFDEPDTELMVVVPEAVVIEPLPENLVARMTTAPRERFPSFEGLITGVPDEVSENFIYPVELRIGNPGLLETPDYNPRNTLALVAVIVAWLGFVTGIGFVIGIVLGHTALLRMKHAGYSRWQSRGERRAHTAVLVGYVGLGLIAAAVVFTVVWLLLGGTIGVMSP